MVLAAALIASAAVAWGASVIVAELRKARDQQQKARVLDIAALFAPAIAASQSDPRVLLTWQPLARQLRAVDPYAFAELDKAAGATFPFTADHIQSAHAHWTTEWLSWERAHDAEYKMRAAEAQASPARAEVIEREKLETYQRRYEEYIRVARALQALATP